MTSSINKRFVLDRPEPSSPTDSKDLRFDLTQSLSPDVMENNANSLMDAIFADVDRMLERGVSLPVEASPEPEVEVPPIQPVVPLESILPPKLAPRDLIPQPADSSVELAESGKDSEQSALEAFNLAEPLATKQAKHLLWFAVLCSSMLVSAAILSYLFREQLTQVWLNVLGGSGAAPTATTASPTSETPSEQDTDFLKYIQRSLDRLAQQPNPGSEKPAAQPSPTVSISPAASPTVVERVYVPVYPSPQTSSTAPNASGAVPAQPPTSANPVRPTPSSAPSNPVAVPTAAPNIAATTHTLIGVLALGERSAALFEINGIPQRIEIGGQIGSSGWALVSINNQEAIVRKNGEVRSIYVGQKF